MEERRNGAAVCYAYDAAGNRVKKTGGEKSTRYHYNTNRYDAEELRYKLLENGKRTSFAYHNRELLYEKAGLSKEETSYHLGTSIDAFQRNRKIFYYHQNEQLSTALVTDRNGDLKNQYQYDAFGIGLDAVEELPNRIRYTGQQYDQQTEQYYLRARYYNPVLGRFMQEDVYQGDGLNLYAYCGNNPVVYYDPSGYIKLKFWCVENKIGTGTETDAAADDNYKQTYYRATSKEKAQELINSENPSLEGGEFNKVYAWTERPTYKQARDAGVIYPETVIQFKTGASFEPDDLIQNKSMYNNTARQSCRPGPISISDVIDVGFKEEKRWWQFWKK